MIRGFFCPGCGNGKTACRSGYFKDMMVFYPNHSVGSDPAASFLGRSCLKAESDTKPGFLAHALFGLEIVKPRIACRLLLNGKRLEAVCFERRNGEWKKRGNGDEVNGRLPESSGHRLTVSPFHLSFNPCPISQGRRRRAPLRWGYTLPWESPAGCSSKSFPS